MARKRSTSIFRDYRDIWGNYHTGYTHATKSGEHQLDIELELKDILQEYADEVVEKKERALTKAGEFLYKKLIQASPINAEETDGKHFKNSWMIKTKYTGVRYIGNSKDSKTQNEYGYNIPLSNLIEFSKNGHPFMRKTFEENEDEIIKIIEGELK